MDNLQWDAILLRYDCNSYSCALLGGSQCMFTEFSQYCTATCSTVLGISNIIQVRIVLYFHSIALILQWGFPRGMLDGIVRRYQLYSDPPCLSLSSPSILLFLPTLEIYLLFTFFLTNCFFFLPFFLFFHFVQLSIVMQALLLNPPQPPFPDLPGFLPGIITFFLPTILATFLWEIITRKISFNNSFKISLRNHLFLFKIQKARMFNTHKVSFPFSPSRNLSRDFP